MHNESKGHSRNKGRGLASSGKRMLDHGTQQQLGTGSFTLENPLSINNTVVKERTVS
jgi:hypothetical protein